MKTIVIPADATIEEGQEIITTSTLLKKNEKVQIARTYGGRQGGPIADGQVVMNMKDDPKAPITQTTGDQKASPWRFYWKVKIVRIR